MLHTLAITGFGLSVLSFAVAIIMFFRTNAREVYKELKTTVMPSPSYRSSTSGTVKDLYYDAHARGVEKPKPSFKREGKSSKGEKGKPKKKTYAKGNDNKKRRPSEESTAPLALQNTAPLRNASSNGTAPLVENKRHSTAQLSVANDTGASQNTKKDKTAPLREGSESATAPLIKSEEKATAPLRAEDTTAPLRREVTTAPLREEAKARQ